MCAWYFLLSHPVHSCFESSLHHLDFFLEVFLWRLVCSKFLSICYAVPLMNGIQQPVQSAPPPSLLLKKVQALSPSYAKAQMDHPQRISWQAVCPSYTQRKAQMDRPQRISWLLVAILNATHIALWHYAGWKKKKINNSDFWPFQACHFKIVYLLHIAITTADWGRLCRLLYVLLDVNICSWAMISPCNANTLIGATISFSGHPYTWAYYSASPQ